MARPACLVAVVLSLFSISARAAEPAAKELVVKLTVSAAAPPTPALRRQLLPEAREKQPGNCVPAFYKCLMEQNHFYYNKEALEQRDQWQSMPLKDLPGDQLKNYGGYSLRQADYAARLENCDWQMTAVVKMHGIGTLLPDIQVLRHVANALKVRFRGEVKRGEFNEAIATAKTMFAMARAFQEHPTLIGNLVGIAIASMATGPLEEMLQQPGAPNLFWALGYLPSPLIEIRNSLQGERLLLSVDFAPLGDEAKPLSEEQLQRALASFRTVASLENLGVRDGFDGAEWIRKRAANAEVVRAAKARLRAGGCTAAQIEALPAVQVIMFDEIRRYEVLLDERLKWAQVPFWKVPREVHVETNPKAPVRVEAVDDHLLSRLTPAIITVRRSQMRLEQRLAMLRHVEAVRMYAAAHDGALPATIDAVGFPMPIDPMSGKPFSYEVKDGVAILRGTSAPGRENDPASSVRFEISVRK